VYSLVWNVDDVDDIFRKGLRKAHRVESVDRVLNFSPVVGIGTPPPPHTQAIVSLPPLVWGGGAKHLLAGEGVGGPNADVLQHLETP
jgi:hypothetical protein